MSDGSADRKNAPVWSGVMRYFPDALMEIARLSKFGNDKHNPGEPLHWSKDKSADHEDCVARHLLSAGTRSPSDGNHRHRTMMAWRALAALQTEIEEERAAPPQRAELYQVEGSAEIRAERRQGLVDRRQYMDNIQRMARLEKGGQWRNSFTGGRRENDRPWPGDPVPHPE